MYSEGVTMRNERNINLCVYTWTIWFCSKGFYDAIALGNTHTIVGIIILFMVSVFTGFYKLGD